MEAMLKQKKKQKQKKTSSSVSKFAGQLTEANGQCPYVRSYISKKSYDKENLMVGNVTNGLKSPNDLYLEAKNQNMSRYVGCIYNVTLSYNF